MFKAFALSLILLVSSNAYACDINKSDCKKLVLNAKEQAVYESESFTLNPYLWLNLMPTVGIAPKGKGFIKVEVIAKDFKGLDIKHLWLLEDEKVVFNSSVENTERTTDGIEVVFRNIELTPLRVDIAVMLEGKDGQTIFLKKDGILVEQTY